MRHYALFDVCIAQVDQWFVYLNDFSSSFSAFSNRTDVEGCCWWGRGVLLTRGVCKSLIGPRCGAQMIERSFTMHSFVHTSSICYIRQHWKAKLLSGQEGFR